MKNIVAALLLLSGIATTANAQNLSKMSEKERNEKLLKTAYETVMKHAPEWYRNYKEPEINSFIHDRGENKGKLVYSVIYYHNPAKEKMSSDFAIGVSITAETGKVYSISFGDGGYYQFPTTGTCSGEKPFYRPYTKQDVNRGEHAW